MIKMSYFMSEENVSVTEAFFEHGRGEGNDNNGLL